MYLSERIEARFIGVLRARFAQFSWFVCMNHDGVRCLVETCTLDGSGAMEL